MSIAEKFYYNIIYKYGFLTIYGTKSSYLQGCYIQGLYIEGARWDVTEGCLKRSHPKILIEELPILVVIPIESHRLKLLVII